jgi:3-oxoadipate enol-lactonase
MRPHVVSSGSDGTETARVPLLFLHGLMTSSRAFQPQFDVLSQTRRVLALDWPGHGRTAKASGPLDLDDLTGIVVNVLDEFRIARVAMVGLSFGGLVALRAALRFPERVDSLVLVSTPGAEESDANRERSLRTLDVARRLGKTAVLKGIAARFFGETTRHARPEVVTAWLQEAAGIDLESLSLLSRAALDRGTAPRLLAPPPTLVLRGAEDTLLTPEDTEELVRGVPGAIAEIVAASGHSVPLEQPEAFSRHLSEFFEQT